MDLTKVLCIFVGLIAFACQNNSESRNAAGASQGSNPQKVNAPSNDRENPSQAELPLAKPANPSESENPLPLPLPLPLPPSPDKPEAENSQPPTNSKLPIDSESNPRTISTPPVSEETPNVSHPNPKNFFVNATLTEGSTVERIHILCQNQLPGTDLANLGIILLPGTTLIIHGSKMIPCSTNSEPPYNKSVLSKRALHKMKIGDKKELEALMLVELSQPHSKKLMPKKVQVRCESWSEGKTTAAHGISIAPGSLIFLDTVLVEKNKKGVESLRAGSLAISCEQSLATNYK